MIVSKKTSAKAASNNQRNQFSPRDQTSTRCKMIGKIAFTLAAFAFFASAALGQEPSGSAEALVILGIATASGLAFLGTFLLPVIVAVVRGHPDTAAITLVTLFFGCTFLGWAVALIWAIKSFPRRRDGSARDW